MAEPVPTSNAAEWTVSELSGALKRTIEDAFGFVRLRGEISGFRGQHSSGHCYFSIKDEGAKIDAVVWKGTYARLKTKPQEGLEVIATGRITTFPGKSSYQIVVESLAPAGVGALMALLEERKRKLSAEGLFAAERKRALPFLPSVVGVITSPTGAVIRDILHRLEDRFPRHVLVWPARVQGETCAQEVAAGVRGFNALPPGGPIPRPDVIIVARGGGSIEDLWGFNDEDLVRAVAQSEIPVVSAVGHETDWTLIDLVADRRAPTPTGAAEMVVPVRADLVAATGDLARRHGEAIRRLIERLRSDLRSAERALPRPEALFERQRQRLDLVEARLAPAARTNLRAHDQRLAALDRRLQRRSPHASLAGAKARLSAIAERPRQALVAGLERRRDRVAALADRLEGGRGRIAQRIATGRDRVEAAEERLAPCTLRTLATKRERLERAWQLVESLGHRSVLARGYALVRDADGRPVRSAARVAPGAALEIELADGRIAAHADGEGGDESRAMPPPPRPRRERPPAPAQGATRQGSLFD